MFNECLDIGWKTAHFCILNFSFKNDFVWEEISNIRHSVSSPDETPRSSSKILRYASYFQLSSRCFIWWWSTASHVWYIIWSVENIIINYVCFRSMSYALSEWEKNAMQPSMRKRHLETKLHTSITRYLTLLHKWTPLSSGLPISSKQCNSKFQLCRSCSKCLSWLVVENNDMSFFQLFQYFLWSVGDTSSDQLLHDPKIYCDFLSSSCCKRLPNPLKA